MARRDDYEVKRNGWGEWEAWLTPSPVQKRKRIAFKCKSASEADRRAAEYFQARADAERDRREDR